ncbi:hypothetical protein [Streptomyces sp. NPDC006510]|uniref:hypothetical protein n=1 Tax=Streptomyces sp. NPDC006510 TaxID=3155600 RepID=UPI0033BFAA7F
MSGAGELRAKESDRIAHTCGMLRAFGVTVAVTEDGAKLRPGIVDSHGDHRLGVAAAVAAACAIEGETLITG